MRRRPLRPRPERAADLAADVSPRQKALDLLARREHSRRELADKLGQRGYDEVDIEAVLDDLAAAGWQSDERFAEAYVRARWQRGEGPLRIAQALRQRGISAALVRASLEPFDMQHWAVVIEQAWRKRFAGQLPQTAQEKARQQRFLLSRGFSHDQIKVVLRGLETETG